MRYLISLLLTLSVISCGTSRVSHIESVITKIDTVQVVDTLKIPVVIPADTIRVKGDTVYLTSRDLEDSKNNLFTVKPWIASTDKVMAIAGITNNVPYLDIFLLQREFLLDYQHKYNKYNTTTTKTKETVKEVIVEVEPKFYNNKWFYKFVIVLMLLMWKFNIHTFILGLLRRLSEAIIK